MQDLHNRSISELSNSLAKREISSFELTEHFLNRIKKYDKLINSFITVTDDAALEAAKNADKRIAQSSRLSLLDGIPIAHKDIFCTKGIKTSCGAKMLDSYIAPYESTITQDALNAGMIMLGKTNMDAFAMGSSNENSYYGPTANPWDITKVPGGSSGGSSACVAAGFTPYSTGSDTGGSIRQPAGFTGITGLKPTYGLISRYGMIAFASSLDQAGIMAKSAEDIAYILGLFAHHDAKDSTSLRLPPVLDYRLHLDEKIEGLTIGLPKEYFGEGLDEAVKIAVENAIQDYKKLGAKIKEISLPNLQLSIPAYYIICSAECSSNLARYDGIRYGYRCKDPINLEDMYIRTRTEGFGHEVKRRIILGNYVLSVGHYDDYYNKAVNVRNLITEDFKKAFESVDVIASPTSPTVAFPIGERQSDPAKMYLSDIYTTAANLARLPAMSLPCGFAYNLPVGLQLIGNHLNESLLLKFAHQYQLHTDWHKKYPTDFERK